jgi:hypothetical protein
VAPVRIARVLLAVPLSQTPYADRIEIISDSSMLFVVLLAEASDTHPRPASLLNSTSFSKHETAKIGVILQMVESYIYTMNPMFSLMFSLLRRLSGRRWRRTDFTLSCPTIPDWISYSTALLVTEPQLPFVILILCLISQNAAPRSTG